MDNPTPKHIPPSNIIYLIVLLKSNFWVACQPTIDKVSQILSLTAIDQYNMYFLDLQTLNRNDMEEKSIFFKMYSWLNFQLAC